MTKQLQVALEQIAELEQRKPEPPSFVKPSRPQPTEPKGPRKKRAAEHNTSRKRSQPTRTERHALEHCPDCSYRLSGESIDYTREVIELPPPQPVEVIEHQVIKRWCPHCETWHSPKLDLRGQVLGQGRIGVRVASLVSYLRTMLRLPFRMIQSHLATLHNLQLSVGELVELTHDVRQQLQPQADQLKAAVQRSTVTHGDETSWRENGQNGYAWAFVTAGPAAVRYFEYDRRRSHLVAQRILGADFRGWLVTDFYAAYNLIPGPHQRCWVHLLRDLHDLKQEQTANPQVVQWVTDVRKLYDDAHTWLVAHPAPTLAERRTEYADLFTRACRLGEQYALTYDHPCCTLAKRLLRHQDELFQFVLVPGLPADNNLAERSIRPLVIMRKISGGSRSGKGTKTRLTLASLLHTWAARNLNPFIECLTALQQPTAAASP
jgi:transposase